MSAFKVGDKVVVLTEGNSARWMHGFEKGTVGTITRVNIDESLEVRAVSTYGNVCLQDLDSTEVKLFGEGCDFCNGAGDYGQWFLNPYESLLCFDVNEFLGINHCPMCGKKLKGEN